MPEYSNQLIDEPSPYLQQHAHNPVDWHPWGDDAFEQARKEDKPVFLSIGYATCHWCHVMAHESFEDPEVAQLLNEHFISIKVDREERPDIDNIYMTACQLTTGSGGWPLTIIMTPDKKPFYAATYIPKQGRFGRPGMLQLLPRISKMWQAERQELIKSSEEITGAVKRTGDIPKGEALDANILKKAFEAFESNFDDVYGGFSRAPKFPSPHNLMFLLRYGCQSKNSEAISMVEKTLEAMRKGGIFDHVGFGFHRYSTDQQWLLPHFEKMLYDQAMLIMAYTEAWQLTQNPLFRQTVHEITSYVLRDMRHPDGGFYSAEDADSGGEEGKFYVWSEHEIREHLPQNQAELFIDIYNFESNGNFNEEASGKRTGTNIPYLTKSMDELAGERNMEPEILKKKLELARQKLFEERKKRVHPLKDDKILTDWNGLMIAALAKAGRVFERDDYKLAAESAHEFLLNALMDDTKLLHRFRDGTSSIAAHADDFAFLIWAQIELYQTTFNLRYLQSALNFQDKFDRHFWDGENGGYFFTSDTAETILQRKKEFYDGALPSANSAAMCNLLRLSRLTGNTRYEEKAGEMHQIYSNQVSHAPTGFGQFLCAMDFALFDSREIVVAGPEDEPEIQQMLQTISTTYLPRTVTLFKPADKERAEMLEQIAPVVKSHTMIDKQPTTFVCQHFKCEKPVHTARELRQKLNK